MKGTTVPTKKFNIIWTVIAIAFMFAVWGVAYLITYNDYVIPSIGQTAEHFAMLFISPTFWLYSLYTILRALASLLISFFLASLFTCLSAISPAFKRISVVIISFFRTLPTMAITLMLLLWSNPFVAPIIVTILVLFPLTYLQYMTAYDGIDKNLIQMATVYSFTRKQKLKNIYLPIMLKSVLAQVGANVSFGLKIVVSAEIMCYTFESLGGAIYHAQLFVRVPQFMALVLFVVVFGAILEWAFSLLNKISERWSK